MITIARRVERAKVAVLWVEVRAVAVPGAAFVVYKILFRRGRAFIR